ncbi:hypothetical protein Tco_0609519, partial [Tanacetum coccineum]
ERKIDDIDAAEDITLENVHDAKMFDVNDLDGDEVVVESEVTDKAGEMRNIVEEAVAVTNDVTVPLRTATITNVELTLAQTLAELKSARPKTKWVKGQGSKDKGKAKMIEPEKPLKRKDRIKFDEEDRLAREKAQQAQEQQELTIKEKSTLFNMVGWKPKDLKNKSFANIQELFDKAMKRVNIFVDVEIELEEGSEVRAEGSETREESSSKIAGDELEQEKAKKQKVDED